MKKLILFFLLTFLIYSLSIAQGAQIEVDKNPSASSSTDGIRILDAHDDGLQINQTDGDGIYIFNAGEDGINILNAGNDAIKIRNSVNDGIYIHTAGKDAIQIDNAGASAIKIDHATLYGMIIDEAGLNAININDAGFNGINITYAGANAIRISDSGGDGIRVDNATGYSMNVQGDKDDLTSITSHVAQIYNKSPGTRPDVLALRVTKSNPSNASNFITFYGGSNAIGSIEGNGSGGVIYGTSGADFAECLPRENVSDHIATGDIVGVSEGKISHNTSNAIKVMVITDRPAVLDNQGIVDDQRVENVSFIGQVPTKVVGKVREGDWIVASGKNNGIGISISPEEITLNHRIVGQAWESSSDDGVKRINTAIGLDHSIAKDQIIRNLKRSLSKQQADISKQQEIINNQQKQLSDFDKRLSKLTDMISPQ